MQNDNKKFSFAEIKTHVKKKQEDISCKENLKQIIRVLKTKLKSNLFRIAKNFDQIIGYKRGTVFMTNVGKRTRDKKVC